MSQLRTDAIVTVPVHAPPGWAPAWGALRLGETEPRMLDAAQWAQAAGLAIAAISVSVDPLLDVAGAPDVAGGVCTIDLVAPADGVAPGTELPVVLVLHFAPSPATGAADERVITVRQPIRAAAPAGLRLVGTIAAVPGDALRDAGGPLADAGGVLTSL